MMNHRSQNKALGEHLKERGLMQTIRALDGLAVISYKVIISIKIQSIFFYEFGLKFSLKDREIHDQKKKIERRYLGSLNKERITSIPSKHPLGQLDFIRSCAFY